MRRKPTTNNTGIYGVFQPCGAFPANLSPSSAHLSPSFSSYNSRQSRTNPHQPHRHQPRSKPVQIPPHLPIDWVLIIRHHHPAQEGKSHINDGKHIERCPPSGLFRCHAAHNTPNHETHRISRREASECFVFPRRRTAVDSAQSTNCRWGRGGRRKSSEPTENKEHDWVI